MRKIVLQLGLALVFLVSLGLAAQAPDIPIGDSPTFGPANAPVTIIEFIDFQ